MSATSPQVTERAADLWSAAGSALQSALAAPIVPVPHEGPSPLSPAQERLYFLMQPGKSGHYNVPMGWRVKGRLDVESLERSVGAIAARHENLRTVFTVIEDRPYAVVSREARPSFQFTDLRDIAAGTREEEAQRLAREQARLPFDLARGPLLRAALYRLSDDEHFFLVTVSQIVFDGWSMRVFSRELALCYGAFAGNEASPLKALPVHWLDYVPAQAALLKGRMLEEERSYWRGRFAVPYRPLDLPYARRPPAAEIPPGTRRRWALPKQATERLHEIAHQEGVTHFAALLAGLQAWLGQVSAREDVIVFTSTFARRRPETREMIGLFANVLPLRTDLSGEPTLRELMRRVRRVVLDAFAHQALPFETIVELLRPSAGPARSPLFQVMLIHQNAPMPRFIEHGAVFTPDDEIDTGTAKFDLLFTVSETPEGLQGHVTYRADVFDAPSMASLLDGFNRFLSSVVDDPDTPLTQSRPAEVAAACTPEPLFVAPRDELEQKLAAVWEQLFEHAPIGVRDDFFHMGGHSLLGLRLLTELEKTIGKRLPLATLLVAPTIQELAEAIRRETWTKSSLVPIQPLGSRRPVFCISGVGGSVMLFHALARHLDRNQPVYGLEPPHLDGAHAPLTSVEDIAAHYIREVREAQGEGPYSLVGFSFGGLVAFEMAQQLVAQGQKIALLAMFDTYQSASSAHRSGLERARAKLRIYRYHLNYLLFGPRRLAHVKRLASGKAVKLFCRFCGWVRRPVPAGVAAIGSTEDVQIYAGANYRPHSYPGRIVLFRARTRPPHETAACDLGWGELGRGGVEIRDVPGDHHTMSVEPNIRELAASFSACLGPNRRSSRSV